MDITFSASALADLENIKAYYQELDAPAVGEEFVKPGSDESFSNIFNLTLKSYINNKGLHGGKNQQALESRYYSAWQRQEYKFYCLCCTVPVHW